MAAAALSLVPTTTSNKPLQSQEAGLANTSYGEAQEKDCSPKKRGRDRGLEINVVRK